jgi:V8-like Glu-specific endopeptidase
MPTPNEIDFVSASPFFARTSGGLELTGEEAVRENAPPKLPSDAAPSAEQMIRATDLFLRGALTPEQLAEARASRGGFEAIIGRPNFLPAVFLEIGASVSRSTCLIRTSGVDFLGRSSAWSGTGFLIGPNVLVTNNHVLNSPEVAAAAQCIFNYQIGPDGQPQATHTFRLRPERLFLTSLARGGLDYTFIWVEGDPGRDFGMARVSRQAFVIAEQEFANVISHPRGRMKEVCVQENEVLWQDELVVHYTSDTEPGSSGASVCNNNWQLVALHHASKPSNVPNYENLNEGVKLAAIAADLERLSQSGAASPTAAQELLPLFGGMDERLGFFGALGRRAPTASEEGFEVVRETYQGTDQDIDVGFWNVEWLTKYYETKTPAVAKVMHALNLDVWSLEESSPNAAEAVAREFLQAYGLDFGHAAAEPESEDGKQSCSLLWNKASVDVVEEPWGEPVETWLQARSPDFDDLGLGGFEAVHGKIFDRYPSLFKVTAKQATDAGRFTFYLVSVHLKAMGEGSLRRKMASKVLAAAIQKKIEGGAATDWVIGGDFNAELATTDFDNLVSGGMVPVSAEDEQGGAFSYIKGPQSLIDHIFLSPNLAKRYREEDYVIVAAEKTFPNYVAEVSDHRPVLVRFHLANNGAAGGGGLETNVTKANKTALAELAKRLTGSVGAIKVKQQVKPTRKRPARGSSR